MFTPTTLGSAWLLVFVSGLLEIVFATTLKLSEGFTRPLAAAVSVLSGMASVWLMSLSLHLLPVGTAYAVWGGIGAVGTAVLGVLWLGEPATLARLGSMAMIVAGIVALQLQGGSH